MHSSLVMVKHSEVAPGVLEEFRQKLLRERERLLRTVARTDEELATLEPHQPGGSFGDDAATALVADVLSRLEGQEKHELDEVDAAQARLAAGTFGVCDRCGQPISLERLRAVPVTRYCLTCQVAHER